MNYVGLGLLGAVGVTTQETLVGTVHETIRYHTHVVRSQPSEQHNACQLRYTFGVSVPHETIWRHLSFRLSAALIDGDGRGSATISYG